MIVSPATIVGWHRQGFRLYWRWKSQGRPGRPCIDPELRRLIRRLSRENPLWGAPRIQAELRLLGCDVAESTVAKYRVRPSRPPSPTWRSFLANHADSLASVDFFVVPTAAFRLLYGFLVLRHDRRPRRSFQCDSASNRGLGRPPDSRRRSPTTRRRVT